MPETPSIWTTLAIVLVVIVAGAAVGGYLWYRNLPSGAPHVLTVAQGDNVTVNYIGIMGSGAEEGKVFDTSFYSVASNNIAYPKTLEFSMRASPKNYTPLPVYVGGSTPSGGYTHGNLSFIGVVTGFWQGLLGLTGNTSRSVSVPPDLGYGPTNAACTQTLPLTYTIPVTETLSLNEFATVYSGVTATTGTEFSDPHFGWPVYILNANSSYATIENLPTVGESASPAGWPVIVRSVVSTTNGSGLITLENELTPTDAGLLLGHDYTGTGPCSSSSGGRFIVSAVDLGAGTYTENFNQEVQGQTLVFIVTVVDIFPPATVA